MGDGTADPEDGGLGQAFGELRRQRREQQARSRQREAAEATRRADRLRVVEDALRRQDEQTRKAVEAFLARVEGIEPDHTVQVGSVTRRRFVPITIETYREPVYERAHLVFSWSRVYGEDAHAAQSVVVRTNGVVMFSHASFPLSPVPPPVVRSGRPRLCAVADGGWHARSPEGEPGLLPFWTPEAHADAAPLQLGPHDEEDMVALTAEDVEGTTEWFVRSLAAYLDDRA